MVHLAYSEFTLPYMKPYMNHTCRTVHESAILTSDRASREGSLPLTDPALTTDDAETAKPLKTEESTQMHCMARPFQH